MRGRGGLDLGFVLALQHEKQSMMLPPSAILPSLSFSLSNPEKERSPDRSPTELIDAIINKVHHG